MYPKTVLTQGSRISDYITLPLILVAIIISISIPVIWVKFKKEKYHKIPHDKFEMALGMTIVSLTTFMILIHANIYIKSLIISYV